MLSIQYPRHEDPGGEKAVNEIVLVTRSGITVDELRKIVLDWLSTARCPKYERPCMELIYHPMRELLRYLRANGIKPDSASSVRSRPSAIASATCRCCGRSPPAAVRASACWCATLTARAKPLTTQLCRRQTGRGARFRSRQRLGGSWHEVRLETASSAALGSTAWSDDGCQREATAGMAWAASSAVSRSIVPASTARRQDMNFLAAAERVRSFLEMNP